MKEKNRLLALKILSAGAVFSACYSLVLVARGCLFKSSGGIPVFLFALLVYVLGAAAGITCGSGGRLAARLSKSRAAGILMLYRDSEEKERAVSSVLLYLSAVVPVLAALAIYTGAGILPMIFETAVILVLYLISVRTGLNSAYDIMTNRGALTGLVVFLVALGVASFYQPLSGLKPFISISSYLYLLAFMVVKNQEDIDYNIFSGKYVEKSVLPREMRIFNFKAVILLFALLLLLLNFKIIALLLGQVGDWLLAGLRALFALLGSGTPTEPPLQQAPQGGAQPFPFMGGENTGPENPISVYIRSVLLTTLLLYLAFKLLLGLYRLVVKKLLPMLRDLLKRLLRPGTKEQFDSEGDYDDEIEIEKPANERSLRRQARARVKKVRRELKGITDPVERVRCMYASALGLLQSKGVGIAVSDTVGEVFGKAARVKEAAGPLEKLSDRYEQVRYGASVPGSGELAETEKSYAELEVLLLKKR